VDEDGSGYELRPCGQDAHGLSGFDEACVPKARAVGAQDGEKLRVNLSPRLIPALVQHLFCGMAHDISYETGKARCRCRASKGTQADRPDRLFDEERSVLAPYRASAVSVNRPEVRRPRIELFHVDTDREAA
jgi:hypothetical protein